LDATATRKRNRENAQNEKAVKSLKTNNPAKLVIQHS
jgi:hypothetical protein